MENDTSICGGTQAARHCSLLLSPVVQNDIVEQLRLVQPARFVHGFRRANVAIEVVEIAPSLRASPAAWWREFWILPSWKPALGRSWTSRPTPIFRRAAAAMKSNWASVCKRCRRSRTPGLEACCWRSRIDPSYA